MKRKNSAAECGDLLVRCQLVDGVGDPAGVEAHGSHSTKLRCRAGSGVVVQVSSIRNHNAACKVQRTAEVGGLSSFEACPLAYGVGKVTAMYGQNSSPRTVVGQPTSEAIVIWFGFRCWAPLRAG